MHGSARLFIWVLRRLPGREGFADVIAATHKGLDCRFYFDPAEGNLLAMEMFAEEDADPCEVYFSQFREIEGRMPARRMEVR